MVTKYFNSPGADSRPKGNEWYLGLDLGQRRDYSALATIEQTWVDEGLDKVTYNRIRTPRLIIRDIERFRLGTSYLFYIDAIADRLAEINASETIYQRAGDVNIAIDAGGPGAPMVEELRHARLGVNIRPVLITGGATPSQTGNGFSTVPRRNLISNMTLLADRGVLFAQAGLQDWATLREELLELGIGSTQPVTSSAHDDMVMAVAMASWQATHQTPELRPRPKNAKVHWNATGRLF